MATPESLLSASQFSSDDSYAPSTSGGHVFDTTSSVVTESVPTNVSSSPPDITHRRKASADTNATLRLVGRGGQGSRPRNLGTVDGVLSAARINHDPSDDPRAPQRSDSTRIVGRGGIGSRPRGLVTPAPPPEPSGIPSRPPLIQAKSAEQPVLYRPGGRGGAGSRPRKAIPASEANETSKPRLFSWKGKGKQIGNASTYGAPTLTRTDTVNTTASSIQFVAARSPGTSRSQYPPIVCEASPSELTTGLVRQRAPSRLNKLARTLGVEFGPRMPVVPLAAPLESMWSKKAARRSSVSGFAPRSESDLPEVGSAPISERVLRRRSSYDPIPFAQNPNVDGSLFSTHGDASHDDGRATPHDHTELTGHSSPLPSPPLQYPAPPLPAPMLLYDLHRDDDAQSEILTYDDASTDDNSDIRTISSTSTTPLQFDASLSESDTEDEERWDRSPTPRMMCADPPSERVETPFSPTEKHFSVPFQQTVPLIVDASPAWEAEHSLGAVIRNESVQGWSGGWNRGDIKDVIASLRELRV
ncbi:hypothetical protein DFH09DRAFT_1167082, partial [Mycena vulgaris]